MSTVNWSDLNDDLLSLIVPKISRMSDQNRFRRVCRSWRSFSIQYWNTIRPGLDFLVSASGDCGHRFLSFSGSLSTWSSYVIDHLPALNPHLIRVSFYYRGWLLEQSYLDSDVVTLTNVISREKLRLPPLSRRMYWIMFSSVPSSTSDCYVFTLFDTSVYEFYLAYCKIGGTDWIKIAATDKLITHQDLQDSRALYHDNKLFLLCSQGLFSCDLMNASPPTYSEMINGLPQPANAINKTNASRFLISYFVEAGGELLLVSRERPRSLVTPPVRVLAGKFRVYKANLGCKRWDPVSCLGEYALVIGQCQSFALSQTTAPEIQRNSIYFLEDWGFHYGHIRGITLGVFDLQTEEITYFSNDVLRLPDSPKSYWITFNQ